MLSYSKPTGSFCSPMTNRREMARIDSLIDQVILRLGGQPHRQLKSLGFSA
jgi:hypothetical protein